MTCISRSYSTLLFTSRFSFLCYVFIISFVFSIFLFFLVNSLLCLFFVFVFLFFFFFFFFSSRRRHTRCLSDWSSDVCSSDLGSRGSGGATPTGGSLLGRRFPGSRSRTRRRGRSRWSQSCSARSEERRVGKECRDRGSP